MGSKIELVQLAAGDDPRTTSELVISLWKHFQLSKFTDVAEILTSREEKMKREIEERQREKELLIQTIEGLELERREKIRLEEECSKLKLENAAFDAKFKEMELRIARILEHVHSQFASGEKKVDEAVMDVKKEVEKPETEEAAGIGIGSYRNDYVNSHEADHGGCKVDRFEAGSQGTTTPASAKVGNIIEILDSDDESTPPKTAPETAQPHPEPSPSIKDQTFVLKRISPSDTSTNHNSCPDVKKITRPQDTIHGSKPTSAAQQKLGSPPPSSRSSQVKETTDAGQYSHCKMLLDLASQLPSSSSSSSSSSDSDFDLDLEISYNPVL
ncbi:hypothetical protein LINPERPRIM_LOCUS36637 [Linum perenne]